MEIPTRSSSLRGWGWSILFSLSAGEALAALIILLSLPADAEQAAFLGLSTRRLALAGLLLFLGGACVFLTGLSRRAAWRSRWLDPGLRRGLFNTLLIVLPLAALASFLVCFVLINLYRSGGDFRYLAYFQRLLPLFAWTILVCLQALLWVAWEGGFQWGALRFVRRSFGAGLLVFGLFALIWLFVGLSRIGITPDVVGWGDPAVPLLEWQIWAAWLVGILFLTLLLDRRWPARRDWIVAGVIWLLAAGLWLSQPIHTAFFATAGRAPNFEIYPFSDGAYYDQFAQNLLIGNGFEGNQVPPRPLYILLLAVFHAIAGQDYHGVIVLQTMFLAFFPMVLYGIGKELHSRPAGLVIALLAILREFSAILTVGITEDASTSQLFFADLPSALVISLWALLALRWLKSRGTTPLLPLLAGGALGLAMLFRTQSIFMLAPTAVLALFAFRWRWGRWLGQLGLLLLGLGLVIAPWLWRNWLVTGQLAFDDPLTQTGVVTQRYWMTADGESTAYTQQPGETPSVYAKRASQGAFRFILVHPLAFTRFVGAHFLNAEIGNLLLLPVRDGLDTPQELAVPTRPFWENWHGAPTPAQALLMLINLGLLALGVGTAWSSQRWAGLTLLLMNFAYNASHALARNSGWRYLLPIDWVVPVYAGIALIELAVAACLVLGISPVRLSAQLAAYAQISPAGGRFSRQRRRVAFGLALILLAFGSLLPLAERVVPRRYPLQTQASLKAELLQSPWVDRQGVNQADLAAFLDQPGVILVKARALYPRYYDAGDGEPLTAAAGFAVQDFPRTVFLTASNTYNGLVIFRAPEVVKIPNSADVIVAGCMMDTHLDAYAVLSLGSPGSLAVTGSPIPHRCQADPGDIP